MTRRNPRRAYTEDGQEIPPPTIRWLCEHEGDRTACLHCDAPGCGHSAVISTDRFPADLPFPDIALRVRCSACGSPQVGVMRDVLDDVTGAPNTGALEVGWSSLRLMVSEVNGVRFGPAPSIIEERP